ncbi:hypothetical protein BH23ACT5_BH23ACT5_21640 [soil metagenome]
MPVRHTALVSITLVAVLLVDLPVGMHSPAPSAQAAGRPGIDDGPSPEHHPAVPVSLTPVVTVRNGSQIQLDRLDLAIDRFAAAGLPLPELHIEFLAAEDSCRGALGLFDTNTTPWRISICSSLDFVYEHELAHSWERATLTNEMRDAFMQMRGHSVWRGSGVPWKERGVEGAAFVIQQGLEGKPLPPVLSTEIVSRLEAFELLTDSPAPRLVEWMARREIPCGERPTPISLTLVDAIGEDCESGTVAT